MKVFNNPWHWRGEPVPGRFAPHRRVDIVFCAPRQVVLFIFIAGKLICVQVPHVCDLYLELHRSVDTLTGEEQKSKIRFCEEWH